MTDRLPRDLRHLKPGDPVNKATVIKVSKAKLPACPGNARGHAAVWPWGRVLEANERRVVLCFSLPPRVLWPNGRPNHWQKSKSVKAHRAVACETASEAMERAGLIGWWDRAELRAGFWWPDLRKRDSDNASASLKAYQDGIADSGLIVADDTGHLSRGLPAFGVDREFPRVEIVIERSA